MTPKEYYQQELNANHIQADVNQQPVIEKLDQIYHELIAREKKGVKASLTRLRALFGKSKPIKGLYLWGQVGIGKTFLMDCFYHCLSVPKMRLHFHQFMNQVHQMLNEVQGQKNPLSIVAKKIAAQTRVICFDEFFVSNIADAMVLGELFRALFENGVTLIASSNIPPDLLYKDGLQRERFLPAIEFIKENTQIIHLHSTVDYRLQHVRKAGVFYYPLDELAARNLENAFIHFSQGAEVEYDPIRICDRDIPIVKRAGSAIWFDFEILCGRPRSQLDYLEIAKQYRTVLVQNLRKIETNENDLILSFIYLVDILYDAHCRLIISSDIKINSVYTNGKIEHPISRTVSRLNEMQTEKYIHRLGEKELTSL